MSAATERTFGALDELRQRRQWVAWRYADRAQADGTTKRTKEPINPHTGGLASSTDPQTWGNWEQATAAQRRRGMDGTGFVLTADDPYVGVDLDACINDTGEIADWAREIVAELDSYAEITPSRRGLRILLRGTLPPGRRKVGDHEHGEIGLYDRARFLTVTGDHLPGTPVTIEERGEELRAVHTRVFPAQPPTEGARPPAQPVDLDDATLLEKARTARNGAAFSALWDGDWSAYGSQSEADLALCGMLAFWTGGDTGRVDHLFRQSGLLRGKWDTKRGQSSYGGETVSRAVSGRTKFYTPADSAPTRITRLRPATLDQGSAISDEWRTYVAGLEQDNAQLREEVARLNCRVERLCRVIQNPHLKGEAKTAIAIWQDTVANPRRRPQHDGLYRVSMSNPEYGLPARSGQSRQTVTAHLGRLADWELIQRDEHPEPINVKKAPDTLTGEITEYEFTPVRVAPVGDADNFLDKLATFKPEQPRNWGGRPDRLGPCPKCGEEGIIIRREVRCARCKMERKKAKERYVGPKKTTIPETEILDWGGLFQDGTPPPAMFAEPEAAPAGGTVQDGTAPPVSEICPTLDTRDLSVSNSFTTPPAETWSPRRCTETCRTCAGPVPFSRAGTGVCCDECAGPEMPPPCVVDPPEWLAIASVGDAAIEYEEGVI